MPIGIGLLCSSGGNTKSPYPDALVLMASVTGKSHSDYAASRLKLFRYPDEKLFGICVGSVATSADLISDIQREFRQLRRRDHVAFAEALNTAVFDHRAQHFQFDVLPDYKSPTGAILHELEPSVFEAWRIYGIAVHLIVGTFDDQGHAVLYVVARMGNAPGWVHRTVFPGVATIGDMAPNANFWLEYRRQTFHASVRES